MRKARILLVAISLVLVAAFAVAACGGDDDDVAASEGQACEALGDLGQAYGGLLLLDVSTASVDDVESAVSDVDSALEDLSSAAGDLAQAQVDNLESAVNDLRSAVDDNSDLPLPDLMTAIQPQIQEVDAAGTAIDGVLECPVGGGE